MVYTAQFTPPPPPPPQTLTVCINSTFSLGNGGGGQREDRGATVHKYSSFVHGGNNSQAGSKIPTNEWMSLQSIKSVKHNAARSVNRSILKKSRHIGIGLLQCTVISPCCSISKWWESATPGLQTLQGSIFAPSLLQCKRPWPSTAQFSASEALKFDFNADSAPAVHSNADLDPASQNNTDPQPCHIYTCRQRGRAKTVASFFQVKLMASEDVEAALDNQSIN